MIKKTQMIDINGRINGRNAELGEKGLSSESICYKRTRQCLEKNWNGPPKKKFPNRTTRLRILECSN